jgi:hypothetical protein
VSGFDFSVNYGRHVIADDLLTSAPFSFSLPPFPHPPCANIRAYAGCDEQWTKMVEVLCKFLKLTKTISNKPTGHEREVEITECTTLVTNTPNMPVIARKISIGIVSVAEVKSGRKLV